MGFTCKNFILDPRIVVDRQEGHDHRAAQDEPAGGVPACSSSRCRRWASRSCRRATCMRIVESATAKSETVPIIKKGVPADEDQIVRYILRPSYAQVETLRAGARLDPLAGRQRRRPPGNMLIITDYASQVRDMMSLAKTIDVPGNNEGIYTIPVLHADAHAARAEAQRDPRHSRPPAPGAAPGLKAPPAPRAARTGRRRSSTHRGRRGRGAVEDPRRRAHEHADRRVERGRLPARQGARRAPRHLARHRGRRRDPRLPARERARRGARDHAQQRACRASQQQTGAKPGAAGRAARRHAAAPAGRRRRRRTSAPRSRARSA